MPPAAETFWSFSFYFILLLKYVMRKALKSCEQMSSKQHLTCSQSRAFWTLEIFALKDRAGREERYQHQFHSSPNQISSFFWPNIGLLHSNPEYLRALREQSSITLSHPDCDACDTPATMNLFSSIPLARNWRFSSSISETISFHCIYHSNHVSLKYDTL